MSCLHGNHEDDCDICAEVGAAWNSGYASGVKIEREACAQVCEAQENRVVRQHPARIEFDPDSLMARKCAAVIRTRGEK